MLQDIYDNCWPELTAKATIYVNTWSVERRERQTIDSKRVNGFKIMR